MRIANIFSNAVRINKIYFLEGFRQPKIRNNNENEDNNRNHNLFRYNI